jgi:ribosome-binding protein aMBF1 (putative translation factor)
VQRGVVVVPAACLLANTKLASKRTVVAPTRSGTGGCHYACAVTRAALRLGEIIRRQREFNRLTLRQFAAMAGILNPYLSQIERGLRMPSEEVIDAIARTLKTSLDEL